VDGVGIDLFFGLAWGHRELEGRGVGNREVVVREVVDRVVNQIKLPNFARWVEDGQEMYDTDVEITSVRQSQESGRGEELEFVLFCYC
jgi:hypothetical protein